MWYSNYIKAEPIYVLDDNGAKIVVDTIDGVNYYLEEGQSDATFSNPIPFDGTIAYGGSEIKVTSYGLNKGEYDGVLILPTTTSPIDEKSLIWVENKPTTVSEDTADYVIVRKSIALNTTYFLLKKVVK